MIRLPGWLPKGSPRTKGRRAADGASDSPPGRAPNPDIYELASSLEGAGEPHLPGARAFDAMAETLMDRQLDRGRRGFAICGASKGTGVTYTAANLALALTRHGVSTLLIDADLRGAGLDQMIRPQVASGGLRELLRGEVGRADVIHEGVLPNLSVLYAGGPAEEADALLSGRPFRQFVREILRQYDCTILDTAPCNRYADARAVAVATGYAVVVGRRGFSFTDDIELVSTQLRQDGVRVVGAIFNGV